MHKPNTTPITPEWLKSIGIYPDDLDKPREYCARIVGASDYGQKEDSDDDKDGDEIAHLVVVLAPEDGSVSCYLETYELPSLNTRDMIELGIRKTRNEILELCHALKAWAIKYPPEYQR